VISLKLIVEDDDIVKKINEHLTPQIRIWGYERTNNGFSAYQMVDSRIYEYLIPTHSFLPPHPRSWMGVKCQEWATKKGDADRWLERQKEVEGYWEKVDQDIIKPILDEYDQQTRSVLEKALYLQGDSAETQPQLKREAVQSSRPVESTETWTQSNGDSKKPTEDQPTVLKDSAKSSESKDQTPAEPTKKYSKIGEAIKRLRAAYITAKRSYRIPPIRLDRIKHALSLYVGTQNYHNFTVDKPFKDASAKRVIKSFVVSDAPILINGTEWLSLKVHGQSFMMHQIRKMVGMVALVVRCGCDPSRIKEAMGPDLFSIPKAPSLGLLLERPVFDSYNKRASKDLGKEKLDFDKFKTEMDEFKQREIYERMYRDEEKENVFGNFFNHVDNFPEPTFLYVTSGGVEATKIRETAPAIGRYDDGPRDAEEFSDGDRESDDGDIEDDKLGAEG
jgi:tRNA pseudouridine38-40 synthase